MTNYTTARHTLVLCLLLLAIALVTTSALHINAQSPAPTGSITPSPGQTPIANPGNETTPAGALGSSSPSTKDSSPSPSPLEATVINADQVFVKIGENEAKGPVWYVLILAGVFVMLALIALRSVSKVGSALKEKSVGLTTGLIILLVVIVGIYFVGRSFGGNEVTGWVVQNNPEAKPSPLPNEAPPAKPVKQEQPAVKQEQPAVKQEQPAVKAVAPVSPTPTPTPYPLSVVEVKIKDAHDPGTTAGLGDVVIVRVKNLSEELKREESLPADAERIEPRKFVLFLDQVEINKLYPMAVDPAKGELQFKLERSPESRNAWVNFLASPTNWARPAVAGVGLEGKPPLLGGKVFPLRIYHPRLIRVGVILFVLALIVFVILAKKTTIIRDSSPPEPTGGKLFRPYSLGRAQVAWWFFIILGSFLFIALVTWDFDTITTSSLVLLGIGTGTALGGAMVDANKRESTNSDLRTLKPQQAKLAAQVKELKEKIDPLAARELNQPALTEVERTSLGSMRTELAAKEADLEQLSIQVGDAVAAQDKPLTEGFVSDLLSDANGITFHRFQIVVWTIVLGLIFIWSVWKKLSMPEFSDTLLALMGISAGTYIGFKIPERQTSQEDAALAGGLTAGGGAADKAAADKAAADKAAADKAAADKAAADKAAADKAAADKAAADKAEEDNSPG